MSQIPKNYNYNAFTKVLLLRYNHNHGTHIFLSVSCFKPVFFKLFSSRPILHSQIFSRPLKKGLHLKSISDCAIFPPTSRCSLKKKKKVFT